MKMSYSVLWFDDTEEVFDAIDFDPINEYIRGLGFEPHFVLVTDPDDFLSHDPYEHFDLIIVDYDLAEFETHGEEFIKQIRDHGVYTEIIFYSANPAEDLWNAVKDKQLKGIFISNRTSILTKIEKVALQSVRKVLDLDNMRGIVMAEVGEIDLKISEILVFGINQLEEEARGSLFNRFYNDACGQSKQFNNLLDEFSNKPSAEELCNISDSDKLYSNMCRLLRAHPGLSKKDLNNYRDDVLIPRNTLAHGCPEQQEDGNIVFKHRGKDFLFNSDVAQELRITIMEYKKQLDAISQKLA